ncbi:MULTISPECIES: hypothetical protein [unclassified Acinetobacter]|uniref:hypothetical protein n=1 Tax=unclassified Acinetobacter TaxID=196816 RepID=UPI0015D45456|nr:MULTISPECIES: hypothetical protein [unclassified Acinetobacter]
MRTDLLLELADFLDKLDPNRFDIRTWRRPSKDSVGFVSDEQLLTDCKTVACAIGWAVTLPKWKDAGFYMDTLDITKEHMNNPLSTPYTMAIVKWQGDSDIDSYDALQAGLNLPIGMAEVLFDFNNYADEEFTSAQTVAERIREFCSTPSEELMDLVVSYTDTE